MNGIHVTVGQVSDYVGLFTFVFGVSTWFLVWRANSLKQRIIEKIKDNPGARPAILVVSSLRGEKDIRNQVENYRLQHADLKKIPEDRIHAISLAEVAGNAGELSPGDVPKFMERLNVEIGKIYRNATDVVHYFHGGPFPTAAMVGAQLSNGPIVLLYHFNTKTGTYENWGMLRHFPYA